MLLPKVADRAKIRLIPGRQQPRKGYRLIAEVERLDPAKLSAEVERLDPAKLPRSGKYPIWLKLLLLLLMTLAVVVAATWIFWR